jgi:hypothetical protein
MTASLAYTRAGWSSTFIWGRNHQERQDADLDSYLFETLVPIRRRNFVTGRVEVVDKDELAVPGAHRVQAYTAGYTRDIATFDHFQAGLGANVTTYSIPDALHASYGEHPWGVNMYLRLRLK